MKLERSWSEKTAKSGNYRVERETKPAVQQEAENLTSMADQDTTKEAALSLSLVLSCSHTHTAGI